MDAVRVAFAASRRANVGTVRELRFDAAFFAAFRGAGFGAVFAFFAAGFFLARLPTFAAFFTGARPGAAGVLLTGGAGSRASFIASAKDANHPPRPL